MKCICKAIVLTITIAASFAGCSKSLPGGADALQDASNPGSDVPNSTHTCREAIRCITEKGCYSLMCAGGCLDGMDAPTAKQIQDIMVCAKDMCDGFSQWETTQMALCVYMGCRNHIEPCTNTGPDNCVSTLVCAQNCGLDEVCLVDCLDAATYEARLMALIVSSCIEYECPDALYNPTKSLECITNGPCHHEYQDCLDMGAM